MYNSYFLHKLIQIVIILLCHPWCPFILLCCCIGITIFIDSQVLYQLLSLVIVNAKVILNMLCSPSNIMVPMLVHIHINITDIMKRVWIAIGWNRVLFCWKGI